MEEHKIRNLEMIQTVILRMSSNCFALKGWTVALIAGILALYGSNNITHQSIIIIFVPIIIFWVLDSYYLQLERKYRKLFEIVKEKNHEEFSMSLVDVENHSNGKKNTGFFKCFFSKTEWLFYVPIIVSVLIIIKYII